ncbi:hypothetical protein [Staphylococcus epidermidis]|uniref:hypothetical protein n=1 Tax=Staphylococcus epidermidis TaxID=1282 RepID=UPI0037D9B338
MPIRPKLTLPAQTIYQFLHKLIPLSLPPLPHFQPLSKTPFHPPPNYTLPLKQQLIFPQIHYHKLTKLTPIHILILTTPNTHHQPPQFLTNFPIPFPK